MLTNWHPLLSRGDALKLHQELFIQLIAVGAEPEQAVLRNQRAAGFDPQDGVGGAICLGEMGHQGIGR